MDKKTERAWIVLREIASQHGILIVEPSEHLDFGAFPRDIAISFGSSIQSAGYRIGPGELLALRDSGKLITAGNLAAALAGNDDTSGND
jgi:hypothetical protein